ncbi:MAG: hypothetical protein JO255_03010 [Alphaproteobacteria bacterium]|nr:hypothetical protein [Alphaproteobacteria bacterium]
MADGRDPRSPPIQSGPSCAPAASSEGASKRRWTARELREIRSIYHLIGHIERDAAAIGLSEVAKILNMASLVIQDAIPLAQSGGPQMLTLVKS